MSETGVPPIAMKFFVKRRFQKNDTKENASAESTFWGVEVVFFQPFSIILNLLLVQINNFRARRKSLCIDAKTRQRQI